MNRATLTRLVISTLLLIPALSPQAQDPPARNNAALPTRFAPFLHDAAEKGDLERVKQLLQEGADINSVRPGNKDTPLLAALKKNQTEVANYLLDLGPDPALPDMERRTPLHIAASSGQAEIVERLISLGAKVNAIDNRGRYPLHHAAERGHVPAVKVLLAHRAELDLVGGFGFAPIDHALKSPKPDLAMILIEAGAKLANDDERAMERMRLAATKNWKPVVDAILKEAQTNPDRHAGLLDTAYDAASIEGHMDLVAALSEKGVLADSRTVAGFTRLFQAVALDNEALVQRLLDAGADPNALMSPSQWTALHAAAQTANMGLVGKLLKAGADANAPDGLGRTPLHVAAINARAMVVSLLIRTGADPARKDVFGQTPLHYAAQVGSRSVVDALLQANAPVDATNDAGRTPGDEAEAAGQNALRGVLAVEEKPIVVPAGFDTVARATAPDNTEGAFETQRARLLPEVAQGVPVIHLAVGLDSWVALDLLLKDDPSLVTIRDAYGYQPLHLAADTATLPVLSALLDQKADPNDAENPARWTPLHFAVASGRADIVTALLDQGADLHAVDGLGRTPADIAKLVGADNLLVFLR